MNKKLGLFAAARSVLVATALAGVQALAQVPIVQPGAPGQPSRQISPEEATALASTRYSAADVRFLQGMIAHHAQALEMTALVGERTARDAMRLLSQRIALSQEDEISMMQSWLRERGLEVPELAAHHAHAAEPMPGMATPQQLEELAQAEGGAFDALFLELMIAHHQGALTMVEELLDQPGSVQDPVLYEFTAEITFDQSSEIERMNAMLAGFSPDPRATLRAGFRDAGEASLNLQLIASLPKPAGFFNPDNPAGLPMRRQPPGLEDAEELAEALEAVDRSARDGAEEGADANDWEPRPSLLSFSNTDLAFAGDVLVAGNYHGFNAYDISDPRAPELLSSVVCPGGQGDVSIVGHLLILSVEQTRARVDCGLQGVTESNSKERFRGIRIFDVSDFRLPKQVGAVQTCRGSHTHTVVTDPDDNGNFYVYVSGTSSTRSDKELEGCSDDSPFENPETALFRIEVIQVPMRRPEEARIVSRPYVFADPESGAIAGLWRGGDHGPDTQDTRETDECHDITAFPEIGLAAGACSGNGILLDISDPMNPVRVHDVTDPGFAYWHSATFNNDGTKVLFTDEWGGGSRPRCRASDPKTWGANAIYDVVDRKLQFRSYFKMPAPQTEQENCVAHNGSLVPVPGRDVFVQAWYQGGISVIDFTDSSNPVEIAYFDRGPIDAQELIMGGYWSAYWFGGLVFGTEIARGLDVLALTPSEHLTANELDAASLQAPGSVFNPQQQRRHVWPAEPVVAQAYVDQLVRGEVIEPARAAELTAALDRAGDVLAAGAARHREAAAQLRSVAASLPPAADDRGAAASRRLTALTATLEALAERLR